MTFSNVLHVHIQQSKSLWYKDCVIFSRSIIKFCFNSKWDCARLLQVWHQTDSYCKLLIQTKPCANMDDKNHKAYDMKRYNLIRHSVCRQTVSNTNNIIICFFLLVSESTAREFKMKLNRNSDLIHINICKLMHRRTRQTGPQSVCSRWETWDPVKTCTQCWAHWFYQFCLKQV